MGLAPIVLIGAVAVVAATALASRLRVAAPLLLVVVGVLLSAVPGFGGIEIKPEWILAGVLPPLLYATSVSLPGMDFRRELTAIAGLSVVLVVLTAVALGLVFAAVLPGIGLNVAIALGAIVSPTDAAATAIVRRAKVSPRLVTILDGESLLNDASALVLLRSAVAATVLTAPWWQTALDFGYAVLVAAAIGALVGFGSLGVRAALPEVHLNTAVSFLVPFLAYFPAEYLGASGLVATVIAGLVAGAGSPHYLPPLSRMAESANWGTLAVLLEGGVFLAMGLQLFGLVDGVRAEHGDLLTAAGVAALAFLVVMLVRAVYSAYLVWQLSRHRRRAEQLKEQLTALTESDQQFTGPAAADTPAAAEAEPAPGAWRNRFARFSERMVSKVATIDYLIAEPLGAREAALITWAGMRGVVTVAAAQTLPENTPQRSLLVLIAFMVAAGTLLLQGGTLPWLVRRLRLARESVDGAAIVRLLGELRQASTTLLADPDLRRANGEPYRPELLATAQPAAGTSTPEDTPRTGPDGAEYLELRLAMLAAQRARLLQLRTLGTADSTALSRVLAALDADQISLELRGPS